ncbi:TPA: L-gulono-gamma-lactone oxidase, partial [Legionella pneumophila]
MDFLLDSGLKHLLPSFMLLSAAVVTGTRGTSPKVDYENHITHPQVAFPKEMRDVSYLIPVKDDEAGQKLELILQKMEAMLNAAGSKGEFPVTYAIYVRYLKGTNGGLSTSFTSSDNERILAIDVVTHPEAPGITNFEKGFMSFLKEMNIIPRNHLGKNFPAGVVHYDQFLGAERVSKYKQA